MKGVYIGALSYADDITILSPSIGGLNETLKICHIFAEKNSILFNSKKTVCIKFGGNVVRNEEAYLNSHPLLWMDKVRHLGNIIVRIVMKYMIVLLKNLCLSDMLTN